MLNFIGFLAFSANKKSISKAKHFVTTILTKIYETNLVLVRDTALREKFNFDFSTVFC